MKKIITSYYCRGTFIDDLELFYVHLLSDNTYHTQEVNGTGFSQDIIYPTLSDFENVWGALPE